MKTLFPLAACALLTSACATIAEPPREDGWAAIGEATRAGILTVTPVEIIEDSRCPPVVQCVWAGRVVVRTVIEGDHTESIDVTLGEEVRVADGLLELDRVEPPAFSGRRATAEDYRFHYRFAPMIMEAR